MYPFPVTVGRSCLLFGHGHTSYFEILETNHFKCHHAWTPDPDALLYNERVVKSVCITVSCWSREVMSQSIGYSTHVKSKSAVR